MILKRKVFGSAMLAAAIMSAGTCTAMAAPQQENTAIEAESEILKKSNWYPYTVILI